MKHVIHALGGAVLALALGPAALAANIVTKTLDLGPLSPPVQVPVSHIFTVPLSGGLTSSDVFYDDYAFTIPAATFSSITAALNLQNIFEISGLSARLYKGDLSTTTTGLLTSAQLVQRWSDTVVGGSGNVTVINPVVLGPGSYVFEVRGSVTGLAGGGYSGILGVTPVPEASTVSMLAAGMLALGLMSRRRKRG